MLEKFFNLIQVSPNIDLVQWIAPIPNDISWWIIAMIIVFACALLTFGCRGKAKRWHKKGFVYKKAIMWAEIAAIPLSLIFGALSGYLVWNWVLGMLCGLIGTISFSFVMVILRKIIKKRLSE
jgi:small-conductance mechanosensitive channel